MPSQLLADTLLCTPLRPRNVPMLVDAIACLFDLLESCEVAAPAVLGAVDAEALLRRCGTLQALIAAQLVDERRVRAAIAELNPDDPRVLSPAELIDRFLVPSVLLDLSRRSVPAAALLPPGDAWLGDVLAALIAVDAYRPLIVPDLAPEELVAGPGCHSDPRLAPLVVAGRWLAGRVGFEALVQAAAGQVPLADALVQGHNDLLPGALALATRQPTPQAVLQWRRDVKPGEQDAAWLEDAVMGLCVRRRRVAGLPCAALEVPRGGGLRLLNDESALTVLAPATAAVSTASGTALDPEIMRLDLPASLCGSLQRAGWHRLTVRLSHCEGLDDLIDVIVDLCEGRTPPQEIAGDGFAIEPEC